MYYILSDEIIDSNQSAILEGEYEDIETEDFPFNIGKSIIKPGFELPIVFHLYINITRGKMTDNLSVDSIEGLVVSNKTRDLLVKEKYGNIQFYPIQIIDEYSNLEEVQMAEFKNEKQDYISKTYDNYFIANVIGLIDGIDHEASDLEYFIPRQEIPEDMPENMKAVLQEQEEDNDIDFIRKLVLDESKVPEDIHIFRLKDCPRILVFKEHVVEAIREAKLTGFVFTPLSEYTDEIPDDDDDDENEVTKEENPKTAEQEQTATQSQEIMKREESKLKEPEIEEAEQSPKRRGQIKIKKIKRK